MWRFVGTGVFGRCRVYGPRELLILLGPRSMATVAFQYWWRLLFCDVPQYLALRLCLTTGIDLAQAAAGQLSTKGRFPPLANFRTGHGCLQPRRNIGRGLSHTVLFGLGQPLAVRLAGANMLAFLQLQNSGVRKLEALPAVMVATVAVCLAVELILSQLSMAAWPRA